MARKGDEMDESGSEFTPGGGGDAAEDRRRRLHRDRLIGFALCIPLWVLSVIPLARESMHGRDGASAVAVYLVVGAITLGVAVALRGIYFLLRRQRFWSPWVFLMAAVLAVAGYVVQDAGPGGLISAPRAGWSSPAVSDQATPAFVRQPSWYALRATTE